MSLKETFLNPILKGNPITVLVLGICSSLAVTVTLKGALVMTLSVTVVTGLSSLIMSLLRKGIPNRVRIIVQLVVVAMMGAAPILRIFLKEKSRPSENRVNITPMLAHVSIDCSSPTVMV